MFNYSLDVLTEMSQIQYLRKNVAFPQHSW